MKRRLQLLTLGAALVAVSVVALAYALGVARGKKSSLQVEKLPPPVADEVESGDAYSAQAEPPPPSAGPDGLETREGRLAALTLAEENQALRAEVSELAEQVEALLHEVAGERMQADMLRAHVERTEAPARPEPGRALQMAGALEVVAVDPALRLVALGGGSRQGMRPGMRFTVLHGERPTAGVRVVEVREQISAAVIDEAGEQLPRPGDRAIRAETAPR